MESVCLELDEGFRESLQKVHMLRGQSFHKPVTKLSGAMKQPQPGCIVLLNIIQWQTQKYAASFSDSLPTPLLPYVTQRQSNFKTKGVPVICEDLFELKVPAATERECRRWSVTEDLKY